MPADTTLPTPAAAGSGWVEAIKRAWEGLTASARKAVQPVRDTTAALAGGLGPARALAVSLLASASAARTAAAGLTAGTGAAGALTAGLAGAAVSARTATAALAAGSGPARALAAGLTGTAASAGAAATGLTGLAGSARTGAAALASGSVPAKALVTGLAEAAASARTAATALGLARSPLVALATGLDRAGTAAGRMAAPARAAAVATAAAGAAGKKAAADMGALSQRGLLVGAAYAFATSRLLGFVQGGLAGTATGEKLSHTTQMLQRSIASAFLPAIEAVIARIQRLTQWFQALSGDQQQLIARFTGLGAAALAAAAIVPRLAGALQMVGVGSPLLLIAGGLAAILTRSEQGRQALSQFGTAAMGAFGGVVRILQAAVVPVMTAVAGILEGVLVPVIRVLTGVLNSVLVPALTWVAGVVEGVLAPVLEFLATVLSSTGGRFAVFGALVLAVGLKLVGSFAAIKAAYLALAATMRTASAAMLGPLGLIVGAVAAVAAMILTAGASTRAFAKESGALAEQVHKGTQTEEKARAEIKLKAALQAEEEAEPMRQADKKWGFGVHGEEVEKQRVKREEELGKAGTENFERILKRLGGKGGAARTDLEGKKDVVSPLELIKKIEQAALAKDTDAPKRAADGIEKILDVVKEIPKLFDFLKPKDNREDPPKAP